LKPAPGYPLRTGGKKLTAWTRLIYRKIRRNLLDNGVGRTFMKIVGAVFSPVVYRRTYVLYRADLLRIKPTEPQRSHYTFRSLCSEDVSYVKQLPCMEEWLQGRPEPLLGDGEMCIAVLTGDRVIAFNLIAFNLLQLPVVHFARQLRSKEAFSEQISVAKEYRGKGIGTALRREVFRVLREKGIHYLYGGTDIHNLANLTLMKKVGFKCIAYIVFVKVLGRGTVMLRRVHT
jgi:GNAT superfamily N-acetyltransferase